MLILPKVHLLGSAEAGDVAALRVLGIEVLVLCEPGMVLPHAPEIAVLSFSCDLEGRTPGWAYRALAGLWAEIYPNKHVLALADRGGGLGAACHLLCCAICLRRTLPYNDALALLNGALPVRLSVGGEQMRRNAIGPKLEAQGRTLWP